MDTDLNTMFIDYAAPEFEKENRRKLDMSFENYQTTKDMTVKWL
jgi:hypothetical protein